MQTSENNLKKRTYMNVKAKDLVKGVKDNVKKFTNNHTPVGVVKGIAWLAKDKMAARKSRRNLVNMSVEKDVRENWKPMDKSIWKIIDAKEKMDKKFRRDLKTK